MAIVRNCLQQKSPLRAGHPTLRNTRILTQTDDRASADSSETDANDNDEYDSDAIDSGREDDLKNLTHPVCDARFYCFHPDNPDNPDISCHIWASGFHFATRENPCNLWNRTAVKEL